MAGTIPSRVNLAYHQLAQLREARGDGEGKEAWMWMRARTHRRCTPPLMHRNDGLFHGPGGGESHHYSKSSLILSM